MIDGNDLYEAARCTIEEAAVTDGLTGNYLAPLDVDVEELKAFVRRWVKNRMDDPNIQALAAHEPMAVHHAFFECGLAIGIAVQRSKEA